MYKTPSSRILAVLALAAVVGVGSTSRAATFPALNDPNTKESHPGKFVWAELFTSDTAAAAKFYTGVFSWTATTLEMHDVSYTVLSNAGHPVAGMRQRSKGATAHAARWISFIAVPSLDAAVTAVTSAGGEMRAKARKFPNLGSLAVATDAEGSPFGLIQSSSGDSIDDEPGPGDWNWFHLFAKNPQAAADFYRQVARYDVEPDSRAASGTKLLLSSGSVNRGGITVIPARDDAKPGWIGIVRVTNLDETLARVTALGGDIIVPAHDAALGSRFAMVADPTGGTVGLVEYINNANPANRP